MPSHDHIIPAGKWLAGAVLAAALSGCLSGGGGGSDDAPDQLVSKTTYGDVRGTQSADFTAYLGIPYAKPPVGELRFAAPEAPASWSGVRSATTYGSDCVQSTGGGSEDCLYLNVFRPKTAGPHPVMVWIHGGAFVFGSGAGSYIPTRLVSHDTVIVTINYRLGRFGFLAHPGLNAESGASASGSYGIMDQQLALKWVRDNIANFGGDADNVTIFGESAGGLSVLSHIVSPASKELFDKAIVQSGSYSMTQAPLTVAQTAGESFATAAGCDNADLAQEVTCLRGKSVAEITAIPAGSVTPTLRPDILPKSVGAALAAGDYAQVPIIAGTNLDEYAYFLASGEPIDASSYKARIASVFGTDVLPLYDASLYGNSPSRAVSAIYTDYAFACNASTQANSIQVTSTAPFYAYEFADRAAPPIIAIPEWLDAGAAHAFEIQYLFGSDASFGDRATPAQVELANVMTRAWTNFARYGDPSATDGTFSWPEYSATNGQMVSFVTPEPAALTGTQFRATHRCNIWAPAR